MPERRDEGLGDERSEPTMRDEAPERRSSSGSSELDEPPPQLGEDPGTLEPEEERTPTARSR